MSLILGIDLGTNSIGWALLNPDAAEVVDMGVRIFQEGVEDIGKGDKEQTRNVSRRQARMMRRQQMRRRRRRAKLLNWLRRVGLLGDDFSVLNRHDPYQLRAKALQEALSPEELAVVLYHLNQRRGFSSSRKTGSLSEKSALYTADFTKDGAIGINETLQQFDPETQTWGAFLASLPPHSRKRARYTMRKWYLAEFDRIWEAQKPHHPALQDESAVYPKFRVLKKGGILQTEKTGEWRGNYDYVRNGIIFLQRPLKSQKDKIAHCTLEPKSRRAPLSHPVAQYFRMLQQVNNLSISYGNRITKDESILTAQERERLIEALKTQALVKPEDVGKIIGIPKEYQKKGENRINLSHQKGVGGCKTQAAISEALGLQLYRELSTDDIETIWRLLYDSDDEDFLAEKLRRRFPNWPENVIQKPFDPDDKRPSLVDITLQEGYGDLSLRAMRNLIPYLEQGYLYNEACTQFTQDNPDYPRPYHHSDIEHRKVELKDYLPKPPDVRNPIVMRALFELRKVVNALIQRYGRPDVVRIELARELKQNKAQRNAAQKKIMDNERANDNARYRVAEHLGCPETAVRKSQIIRYRLWEEMGKDPVCPYSGVPIGVKVLFSKQVEFEHIIPRSRRPDDSFGNKTLAYREVNAFKGEKTPYEAFGQQPVTMQVAGRTVTIHWEGVKERAKKLPPAKARRILMDSIEEMEGFVDRQLNDTRYMSRMAKDYLKHICADVQPLAGGVTAELRRVWGMTSALTENNAPPKPDEARESKPKPFLGGEVPNPHLDFELHESELSKGGKNRLDHRHHAIDAVVIALTERRWIQKLNTLRNRDGKGIATLNERMPWPDLVKQVKDHLACLIISFRKDPITKVQGKIHKETVYSVVRNADGFDRMEGKKRVFASREKLSAMKDQNSVEYIIDRVVRNAARDWLRAHGVNVDKTDAKGKRKYEFKAGLLTGLIHPRTGHEIRAVRVWSPSETFFKVRGADPKYPGQPQFANYDNYYVQNDGNHHITVFATADKKGQRKQIGEVVTLPEAYRRRKEALRQLNLSPTERKRAVVDIVRRNHSEDPQAQFLYALQINDLFLLTDKPADYWHDFPWQDKSQYHRIWEHVYRIQKVDQEGRFGIRHHTIAKLKVSNKQGQKTEPGYLRPFVSALSGIKLAIDPLGYLSIATE